MEAQDNYVNEIDEEEREGIAAYLQDRYWSESSINSITQKKITNEQQKASAVILQKDILKEFFRNSRNFLRSVNAEHTVIKILDKKGLDENLIFLFEEIENEHVISLSALRIIKSNGEEKIIDIDRQAVTIQSGKLIKKRIVIPNLEIGDIIDYYTYLEFRVLFPQHYSRTYDPVYIVPQTNYPIVDYNLVFSLGPSAFMNVSAFEMPEFDKTAFKVNKRTFTRFSLHQQDLQPYPKNLPYFYPFQTVPNLKFQIFIGPYYGNTDIKYNLGGTAKMNTNILPAKLQDYMVELTEGSHKEFYKRFKKQFKSDKVKVKRTDDKEVVDLLYNFYRQYKLINTIKEEEQKGDNNHQFTRMMHYTLNKLNIDHDIIVAFDRRMSNIDQFVLTEEMDMLIRIKEDSIVLEDPDRFSFSNELSYQYEGSPTYTFTPKTRHLDKSQLPISYASDNSITQIIDINLSSPLTDLEVNISTIALGHQKKSFQSLFQYEALLDLTNEKESKEADLEIMFKKKELSKIKNLLREQKIVEEKQAIEKRENQLTGIIGKMKDSSYVFIIEELGHHQDQNSFKLKETFVLEEFNNQIQDNILIPIGSLVLESTEWDTERLYDINFDYPHSFNYTINFTIPESYTLGSIDHLRNQLSNDVGNFESTFEINDRILTIALSGSFDHYFLTKDKWEEVIQLLEAANKFRQQTILLRKGEE